MSSLASAPVSPVRESSSLPRRTSTSKPPLRALYDLLIAPMEGGLMHSCGAAGRLKQLVLVLEGELYLIPFALLKGSCSNEYLYERFSLIAVPSIGGLTATSKGVARRPGTGQISGGISMAAVVGNPRLPSGVMDRWLWGPMPSAEEEALMVAEQLGCQALTGTAATKERVMASLSQAECVHFATHVSWKLAALVLSPAPDAAGGASHAHTHATHTLPDDASDAESICDSTPLQDILLTAADILDLKLPVKLVVLGSYQESVSKVTADGVVGLTRAFLSAGAQCVCVSLWPVPVAASKLFTHTFYASLLTGARASAALVDAMRSVQSSKQFSHPSNWAGFMLIGSDVKLNSASSLIGQALAEILQYPDKARDALRVLLHLVEKSLQRIQNGQRNSMYTSQQSVENKVGGVPGWQNLLMAVGFRLDLPGTGLPAAVFFPTADPGDRLQQCSATLQSLLGLPHSALQALCKLIAISEAGEQLINRAAKTVVAMLHQVLVQLQSGEREQDFSLTPIQTSISVQLWRLPGCHEFLAALGFDLCEVGQEEVVLKTGKLASRRIMQFALQSLLALFDSTELPKRLSLDSSSSLESLASSQSVCPPLPFSSPAGPDTLASDAISLYSLSSVASSLSFLSRPDGGSGAAAAAAGGLFSGRQAAIPRSRSSPTATLAAAAAAAGTQEEYEGYSIISSEPLAAASAPGQRGTLPRPTTTGHRAARGAGAAGGGGSRGGRTPGVGTSSKGSVSTPTSPVKAPPPPSPPKKPPGSSDTGESSDQSSTETDSTVRSQEERPPPQPLDPQELAQKILEETQSHLIAVESLHRTAGAGQEAPPVSGFRSAETSAFTRPASRGSQSAAPSPNQNPRPKPPSRSSSLQKASSGYNSPATSDSLKDSQPSPSLSGPSPSLSGTPSFKLKYPSSPYSGHISRSPSNVSPSSGHQSPGGSAPSPALSYSSGSSRSSPGDAPLDRLRLAAIDEKVQAIHNLKTFWACASQPPSAGGPVRALRAGTKMSPVQRDVLGLLHLSPRHTPANQTQQDTKNSSSSTNGKLHAQKDTPSSGGSPAPQSIRLPSGNGYKFLSPGRFFPSSKC